MRVHADIAVELSVRQNFFPLSCPLAKLDCEKPSVVSSSVNAQTLFGHQGASIVLGLCAGLMHQSDEELARLLQAEEQRLADDEDAAAESRVRQRSSSTAQDAASTMYLGTKETYDCSVDKWNAEPVRIRVENEPFQEGGMRLAFKARELYPDGTASDVVLKLFRDDVLQEGEDESDLIACEAMTQMVAEDYAQQFNKLCASRGVSHCVAFVPVSVVRLRPEDEPSDGPMDTFSIEPFLPGEYVKYSDNDGHTENEDEVAVAFSFFTYSVSGGAMVITDIQGVGTFYTDPQVHTMDGEGFGAGNLGERGIRRYLQSHRHNLLCERLGLASPDAGLTDEELARKFMEDERRLAEEDAADEEARIAEEEDLARAMSELRH